MKFPDFQYDLVQPTEQRYNHLLEGEVKCKFIVYSGSAVSFPSQFTSGSFTLFEKSNVKMQNMTGLKNPSGRKQQIGYLQALSN